jgi:hypothetical protein
MRQLVSSSLSAVDFPFVWYEYVPESERQRRWDVDLEAAACSDAFMQYLLDVNNSSRAMTE